MIYNKDVIKRGITKQKEKEVRKMKETKYCVIGGQYEIKYYGTFNTSREAKRRSTRNEEYWDNWQGWNKPRIYMYEDTEERITKGWITYNDGCVIRVPKAGAQPAYYWSYTQKRWIENDEI